MTKEIAEEFNKIKETQVTIIENLIEMNKFLQYVDNYLKVNSNERKKFLEKEMNSKWWQF